MLIVPSTKGSCFENITDDEIESMMNELNHRPRKTLISKHLMRYFLLNYCKKSYEYQDCTSELNPRKVFQLISSSTFGLQKKCFPMPIIARYGNGARGYLTMFANRKQAAIKTRPLATTRRMQALFKIAWVKHGLLKPTPPKVAESTGYIAPWISPPLFQYATLKINVAGQNPGKTPSLSAIKTI
jgi:hypothetical protein